jgi:hypothetical protein
MEMTPPFKIKPLTLESEFKVQSVKARISQLSRKDLETLLSESLELLVSMTNQTQQMRTYIESLQGKIETDNTP